MYLVARGSIRVVDEVEFGGASKFASLEAEVDGVTWHVFIVDGASNPLASRADVLSRVLAESQGRPRTIVMGDFNTPAESALFKPWRAQFLHAFDEAGGGLRETWPRWMPVLTIDHVWSSQDAPPLRAVRRWLPSSDHAALLVEVGKR
jgi:endonuclease/exonuclease/phosphatase (EEP) superfamily protein YafD